MFGKFAAAQEAEMQNCVLITVEGEDPAEKYRKSGDDRDSTGEESPAALRTEAGKDKECEQDRATGIKDTWESPSEGDENAKAGDH